mmetsp:Transcript_61732/g.108460  ORF Transcript_61732/g.108460 Transcript_61732/m.108460 type:complete len:266 (-) Transcript_61732:470-1267(-)
MRIVCRVVSFEFSASTRTLNSLLMLRSGAAPEAMRQPSNTCFSSWMISSTSLLVSTISLILTTAALTSGRMPTTSTVLRSRLTLIATPNSSCRAVMLAPPLPMIADSALLSINTSVRMLCRERISDLVAVTLSVRPVILHKFLARLISKRTPNCAWMSLTRCALSIMRHTMISSDKENSSMEVSTMAMMAATADSIADSTPMTRTTPPLLSISMLTPCSDSIMRMFEPPRPTILATLLTSTVNFLSEISALAQPVLLETFTLRRP